MKRGFIRALWGIHDKSHRILARRFRTDDDMNRIKANKFNEPFITYIMGKENYEAFHTTGFDCKMICEEPQMFDLVKYQFRNKLEIIKYAFEKEGYDELVYLDWDCVPQKKIPEDFWDVLHQKDKFQACLQLYHRRKCHWRSTDLRKVPNGGLMYIGDKEIIYEAIKLWEETGKNDSDEIAWAKLTDNMVGKFDMDMFWDRFEIPFGNLHRASPYPSEKLKSKDVCFVHYQG